MIATSNPMHMPSPQHGNSSIGSEAGHVAMPPSNFWLNEARAAFAAKQHVNASAILSPVLPWVKCPCHHSIFLSETVNLLFAYVSPEEETILHSHKHSLLAIVVCDIPHLREYVQLSGAMVGEKMDWNRRRSYKCGQCVTMVVENGEIAPFVHRISPMRSPAAFVAVESPLALPPGGLKDVEIDVEPAHVVEERWPATRFSVAVGLRLSVGEYVTLSCGSNASPLSPKQRLAARVVVPIVGSGVGVVGDVVEVVLEREDGGGASVRTFCRRFALVGMRATVILPGVGGEGMRVRLCNNGRYKDILDVVVADIYAAA